MILLIWFLLMGCYVILSFTSIALLYVRRGYEMLKARSVNSMFLQIVSGLFLVVCICWREYDRKTFPCGVFIVVVNLFMPLYFLPMMSRVITIKYMYTYSPMQDDPRGGETLGPRYLEDTKRRRGYMYTAYALIIACHIVIAGIQLWMASQQVSLSKGCIWERGAEFITMAVVSGMYAITFAILLYLLQGIDDKYDVAKESRLSFWVIMIFMATYLMLNAWPYMWQLDAIWAVASTLLVVMMYILHIILIILPIHRACKPQYVDVIERMMSEKTKNFLIIEDYMDNSRAMISLEGFCHGKESHLLALQAFVALYNYLGGCSPDSFAFEAPTEVNTHYAETLVNFIKSTHFISPYRDAINESTTKAINTIVSLDAFPMAKMFTDFYTPFKNMLEKECIVPFSKTEAFETICVEAQTNAIIGNHMNIDMSEHLLASSVDNTYD